MRHDKELLLRVMPFDASVCCVDVTGTGARVAYYGDAVLSTHYLASAVASRFWAERAESWFLDRADKKFGGSQWKSYPRDQLEQALEAAAAHRAECALKARAEDALDAGWFYEA
jgi:hypothetical protein